MTRPPRRVTLLINDILAPAGTERAVVNLANTLSAHGHAVEIVSLYTRAGTSFYPLAEGVILTHARLRMQASAARRFLALVPRVLRLALARRRSVLIGTNHAINTALGLMTLFSPGTRSIGCEHVTYHEAPNYARHLRKLFYPRLRRVVVLTEDDRHAYERLDGLTTCTVIPNELPFWSDRTADPASRTMIAIGRLIARKGFDLLIDSVAEPLQAHPDWSLTIVGEGEEEGALRVQIQRLGLQDRIHLLTPTREVERLYLCSSIYLMSSRFEAFGMVLIEAKACGLPIVAYDCPSGPREILTPQDGFLIPMGDQSGYADAVSRLMDDQHLRQTMGVAARKDARRFSPEVIYQQWAALLGG